MPFRGLPRPSHTLPRPSHTLPYPPTPFHDLPRPCVQVVSSILFNATQNAFAYGSSEGHVDVAWNLLPNPPSPEKPGAAAATDGEATDGAPANPPLPPPSTPQRPGTPQRGDGRSSPPGFPRATLRIRVINRAGTNHARLRKLVQSATGDGRSTDGGSDEADLLALRLSHRQLQEANVGGAASTFWGLDEIRVGAAALGARARLCVRSEEVLFELLCPVGLGPEAGPDSVPPSPMARSVPGVSLTSDPSDDRPVNTQLHGMADGAPTPPYLRSSVGFAANGSAASGGAHANGGAACGGGAMSHTAEQTADGTSSLSAAMPALAEGFEGLAEEAEEALHTLPPSLVFVCADDDVVARLMAKVFMKQVEADEERSCVLGETFDEAQRVCATVRALAAELGDARVIVHIDQNMDYDGHSTVLGTDVCRQLRQEAGFTGIVAIISANDDAESARFFHAVGADVVSGKSGEYLKTLPAQLAKAHHERFGGGGGAQTAAGDVAGGLTRRAAKRPAKAT